MSESLSNWLAIREPADRAARSASLTRAIVAALPPRRPVRILDLGAGTGSNFRYLTRFLPRDQEWLLVDQDPALLSEVRGDPRVHTRQLSLGGLNSPEIFDRRDLVTASALLDLVSEAWLHALAAECRRVGALALFALTYNGESRCSPIEPEDDTIRTLMNRHQRNNDKGFGRAAGPEATDAADRAFGAAGYRVRRERSDWMLTADQRDLQRHLFEGWAAAAVEMAPGQSAAVRSWLTRRLAHVDRGESSVVVGHEDLAALLDRHGG